MGCATIDEKASTSNINNNTDNVLVVNDEAMEQVNNNPTTSGTNNNAIEQKVLEEAAADEDKCVDNIINIIDRMDDQDEMTKMPSSSSATMMIATTMIVKGKRTKRQRIHSPIIGENKCTNNQQDNVQVMTADEDEEMDMANCLILLAQGPSRPLSIRRNELGLFTSSSGSAMRFTSENKKSGYNNNSVYECKTCNRTFPSFQALGGHRASHKKLKITTTNNTADNDHSFSQMATVASSPLSLQLGNINYTRSTAVAAPPTNFVAQNNSSNRNRIHECAICGAEFSSGQALGGHMRRHRGPITPLNSSTTTNNKHPFANTTLSLSTAPNNTTAVESKVNGINDGFLSLDLNLPASPSPIAPPPEHDETKLSEQQPQTSSGMVLSTPALVDCFY